MVLKYIEYKESKGGLLGMRLFISYARVDKPFCQQIVETLDVHEVWYDHRLHAGQKWWEEILRRLTWSDGFVYLLSKESVTSEYCKQEFTIAQSLGKHIFPVLIHPSAPIPDALKEIQYVDLSKGLDVTAVKQLLSAIIVAERELTAPPISLNELLPAEVKQPPAVDLTNVIDQAAEALDSGNFDRAVFLLKRAQESGYESRFVDIKAVLKEAEVALERQSYLREAEREYRPIAALVKHQRTFHIGCKAFAAFRRHFPDYDPENLTPLCAKPPLPALEWCDIPAGEVVIEREKRRIIHHVDAFKISKFPITNAQFQVFVEAADGYRDDRWWGFSPEACEWHKLHSEALESKFAGDNYPRANVCWYEAMAFCLWLSEKSAKKITLPTEQQWQRAAQGDTQRRYPWGNKFDKTRCNTNELEVRMTTPVDKYPTGVSPFGVYDMAGNVWEWCLTRAPSQPTNGSSNGSKVTYIVRGGSFLGSAERARNNFYFKLDPIYRYFTIGFRLVDLT
jgi:formylglycine-generating enzyme required for sulfatase activity